MTTPPDAREDIADEPRVYITREDFKRDRVTGHLTLGLDTSAAESFGRRIYVLSENAKPWNPAMAMTEARATLAEFDAATDYVILIGPPILCAVVLAVAADRARQDGYTHVRVLYWYGREGRYDELAVPVAVSTWED